MIGGQGAEVSKTLFYAEKSSIGFEVASWFEIDDSIKIYFIILAAGCKGESKLF